MENTYDTIIVGGGFAGLSAAALLAQQKRRVLLLEGKVRFGGRASYHEADGFVWQYGQHSHRLGTDGLANAVFRRLGTAIDFLDTRGHTAYLYRDGLLCPRPEGPFAFLRTRLMSLPARLNFLRFYARLLRLNPAGWYDATLLDCYREGPSHPEVESFLPFLGFTVMLPDASAVSAGEVIAFLQRAQKAKVKQGEPREGAKQIIDKLASLARDFGAQLETSQCVTDILLKDGKVSGVRTERGDFHGARVVHAAPVSCLFTIIDKTLFPTFFRNYVENIEVSHGISIDFVFDEPVTDIKGGVLGIQEPLWVKFQTNIDPAVAPPGKHVHTWAMLLPRGQEPTAENFAAAETRIRTIMDELLPGATKKAIHCRRLPLPVVNANVLTPRQSYPHRPAIVSPHVQGLYLIGDTVQAPGCSGDIAFASALALADILADEAE